MKKRNHEPQVRIFSGDYNPTLAQNVADSLKLPLDQATITRFSNGEVKAEVPARSREEEGEKISAVRGDHVFIIQSHGSPDIDANIMEHLALVNAARRASAADVTAVMPYRGYSRADRPDNSHESFMGPLVMRAFAEAGANRIIEIDPHSGQAAGFLPNFHTEYTAIPAHLVIDDYIRSLYDAETRDTFAMVAPDSGRTKMNRHYADRHKMGRAIVDKLRTGPNEVETGTVVGDVQNKHCIMIDDMIDTGGTILKGAQTLREKGASSVSIIATHGILSGNAISNIIHAKEQGVIERIAVTDTLKMPQDTPEGLIDVISVVPLIRKAIKRVYNGESVSEAFN
ncbi:MAG: ribose-phosphate pyrophosphokinase [Candidatus Saccharimonas sp.]